MNTQSALDGEIGVGIIVEALPILHTAFFAGLGPAYPGKDRGGTETKLPPMRLGMGPQRCLGHKIAQPDLSSRARPLEQLPSVIADIEGHPRNLLLLRQPNLTPGNLLFDESAFRPVPPTTSLSEGSRT
jgi:hypothetical protein